MNGELRKVLQGAGMIGLGVTGLVALSALWVVSRRDRAAEAIKAASHAQTKGSAEKIMEKVVYANAALRAMEQALEAYFRDNGRSYPAWTTDANRGPRPDLFASHPEADWGPPALLNPGPDGPSAGLTTPVVYLREIFPDPFGRPDGRPLAYYSAVDPQTRAPGWVIWSPGPDGDYDINWRSYNPNERVLERQPFAADIYNPNNGFLSDGDLVRIKN